MSSKISIVPYTPNHQSEWESFIKSAINGTIFQERAFINYHPEGRFQDESLLFYRGNKLRMVFPAALQIRKSDYGEEIRFLRSHPGTSYGGPAIQPQTYFSECMELMQALEEHARDNNFDRIEFRTPPSIFQKQPCEQLEYSFFHQGYKQVNREIATCYDLEEYRDKDLTYFLRTGDPTLDRRVRTGVKRGLEAGMELRRIPDSDVEVFHNLLSKNLEKHGASAVHTVEEIRKINQTYGDRCELIGVYLEERLVAAYYVMTINERGRNLFYITMDYDVQHLRPNNFGIASLLLDMAQQGYKYMNMGISTEQGGAVVNTDLLGFKESFGGLGIIRTNWAKDL